MTLPDRHAVDVVGEVRLEGAGGRWHLEARGDLLELQAPAGLGWRSAQRTRVEQSGVVERLDRGLRIADLPLHVLRGTRVVAFLGAERPGERRWPRLASLLDRLARTAPFRVAWLGSR